MTINLANFGSVEQNRKGAFYDTLNMTQLFSELSYVSEEYDDKSNEITPDVIKRLVKEFKKNCVHDKVASFIIFIGSHGKYGEIIASNHQPVRLFKDIVYPMTCSEDVPQAEKQRWASIPKIFIKCLP